MKQWRKIFDRVCNNENNREKYQELNMKLEDELTEEEKMICKYVKHLRLNIEELEHPDIDNIRRQLLTNDCNKKSTRLKKLLDDLGWEE